MLLDEPFDFIKPHFDFQEPAQGRLFLAAPPRALELQ